jgi:hypothetical protein
MAKSRKSGRTGAESKDESRLAQLTREWFAEARATSEKEQVEFAVWNSERKKWTRYGPGGFTDGSSGDSSCGGD